MPFSPSPDAPDEPAFPWNAAGATDPGRVRPRNEDAFQVLPEVGVAVVSDGMGGAPAGALASQLVVREITRALAQAVLDGAMATPAGGGAMLEAFRSAQRAIESHVSAHPEDRGMGATGTALLADGASGRFVVGHVGDSRAYLLSGRTFHQLTRDHTLVQDGIEQGRIPPRRARGHPLGHILSQVVGMEGGPTPQIVEGSLAPGDEVLLCTDGVVTVLEDRELAEILVRGRDWPRDALVSAILDAASARGGPDNATAILIRLGH